MEDSMTEASVDAKYSNRKALSVLFLSVFIDLIRKQGQKKNKRLKKVIISFF